jgi:hypothetical protein
MLYVIFYFDIQFEKLCEKMHYKPIKNYHVGVNTITHTTKGCRQCLKIVPLCF